MTDSRIPRLRTPGIVADELREPLSRVLYVLRTRGHIRPTALAGRLRLYDRNAVAMVRHELNAIDARRSASIDALQSEARRKGLRLTTADKLQAEGDDR